ncbi:kinesin-domain-containing protein [Fomitiporia mediterranea MF3/22]|uniref:kinesin-domain-containing protein n=1 Tax=Fomitiporia mediterranea (strain MF3/22) TaxID=694068 RepID=UPI00044075F7|nr:kinesin-domain-containing protein [Fomitiporia mediterranea MF3/22]EJC98206.1 kinesin-domain-containing protein [Fomitiporia mediterranea MF3/22]
MATKICIAARLRPSIPGEIVDDAVGVQSDEDGAFVMMSHPRDNNQRFKFPFSSCYGPESTQEEIYNNDVKPLLDIVFGGVTVTVFAYGVTSSGKTHTIQGSKAQPGVIPRVVKDIFERSETIENAEIGLSVSYMEIYKEEAYDLLVDRDSAPKLPIREDAAGQVFVAHLSSIPLSSAADFDRIYNAATKRRSVGSTNLNHSSSRSHAILTLHVQMVDLAAKQTVTGKINLVDLAGSENNKLTGNDPARMAESAAINKSLSVLGQVVHALNQGASRIPYRNSKLTRILQDALGGTAVGLLICNLAPGTKFRQDTWNTLNFATRTKEIENKPVVNVRDNQPAPKPHFAALASQVPCLPPANVTSSSRQAGRPSLLPAAGSSKLPGPSKGRVSNFGIGGPGGFQPFTMGTKGTSQGLAKKAIPEAGNPGSRRNSDRGNNSGSGILGMTEEEIDERIARAVEIEVARRLEERERRREEEERKEVEKQVLATTEEESHPSTPDVILSDEMTRPALAPAPPAALSTLPSGVLTPLLRRHEDLDNELKRRLAELEQKYEQSSREVQLADVLSPTSKKKTGRAYVALARAHSEKGNMQVALNLYKKAESYVPDNVKLRQRIVEIEYAVNNNVEFVPKPKKKKCKSKKATSTEDNSAIAAAADRSPLAPESSEAEGDDHDGDSVDENCRTSRSLDNARNVSKKGQKTKGASARSRSRPAPLGEATNSPTKQKRVSRDEELDEEEGTPPKKQKKGGRGAKAVVGCTESGDEGDEDQEWLPENARALVT